MIYDIITKNGVNHIVWDYIHENMVDSAYYFHLQMTLMRAICR